MKRFFTYLFLVLPAFPPGILAAGSHPAPSGRQYALVIGIDKYNPPPGETASEKNGRSIWLDLDGCVNDAKSVRELIVSRFGFQTANINSLFDGEATRAAIIGEMESLARTAREGDVVFIYYAGHGSQVINSLSAETDKKDESIVPADSYSGALDIRDKELAVLYNKILDKGATLTVIFDSCHSGSASRGDLSEAPKFRFMDYSTYDAKDSSQPVPPENRGALVIAAAQDFEYAMEQRDENNVPHGAFTLALLKALRELPVDVPAKDLFSSVVSVLKFYGKSQEPVLAGSSERQNMNLFGIPAGTLSGKILIPVIKNSGSTLELQGGFVSGLYAGTTLRPVSGDTTVRAEVQEVTGAGRSTARITAGDASSVKPGDLFEVVVWQYPAQAALRVYIPRDVLDPALLSQYAQAYVKALEGTGVALVADPTSSDVQYSQYYESGTWMASAAGEGSAPLDLKPDPATIRKSLPEKGAFFVNFPPPPRLHAAFVQAFDGTSNVEIVSTPGDAQYILAGRLDPGTGQIGYGFIKSQLGASDSASALPLRTDFVSSGAGFGNIDQVGTRLIDYATRLAKIRAWLMIESPGGGTNRFPFELAFEKVSGEKVRGAVEMNDILSIYLAADTAHIGDWDRKPRYVYLFAIDSKGNMGLIYPDPTLGSVGNRLPVLDAGGNPREKAFLAEIEIVPPAGTDHYFLLSTDQPIPNLSVFDQEGVQARGADKGRGGALDDLLNTGNGTRSVRRTRSTWSLQKMSLKAAP